MYRMRIIQAKVLDFVVLEYMNKAMEIVIVRIFVSISLIYLIFEFNINIILSKNEKSYKILIIISKLVNIFFLITVLKIINFH